MNRYVVDGRYKDILNYHNINVEAVLKKAQLPLDILNHKTITMSENQYYNFLDAIETVGNVKGLAIKLSTSSQIEHFSPPIFAAFCSQNGLMCVERLAQYKKLIAPMKMIVEVTDKKVKLVYKSSDKELTLSRFIIESEFSFIINILRKATRESIVPTKATSTQSLLDNSLESYIGIAVDKGNENSMEFNLSDMEIPFISHDEGMWDYFEPELKKRIMDLDIDDSFSARVRATLIELLPAGLCSIDDVANQLNMSKRSLQRKLNDENTTFQKQLNNTRELLALNYINNTDMTTNDIAFLLSYAELNSFLRAFTLWTGKSVSEYKKSISNRNSS